MPPLPPVSGQGDFAGVRPLSSVREEPVAPTTLPPPLPEEAHPSTIVEELPPPGDSMAVDAPPSPSRVYHPVTGTPLPSRSLIMHSPSPVALPSTRGDEVQQREKRKKKKSKGKGRAVVLSPEPSPPPVAAASAAVVTTLSQDKKALKRKRAPSKPVPSEPGPSRPTRARVTAPPAADIPSDSEASDAVRPTVKKPRFSPKKVSSKVSRKTTKSAASGAPQGSNRMFSGRPKQHFLAAALTHAQDPDQEGVPIDRHNSRAELENYRFEDLITAPDEFFE